MQSVCAGLDPFVESRFGAILLIDISGFTALTQQFAVQGADGAERLSGILQQYFGEIVDIITDHGGDVLVFAGDSALAMWVQEEGDCTLNVMRATQAALTIQSKLDRFEPVPGVTLRQRAGIACGSLELMELGGVSGRWQFVVTGEPIRESALANQEARPGEILLTAEAGRVAGNRLRGTQTPSGFTRVIEILSPEVSSPSDELSPTISPADLLAVLSQRVPAVVSARLNAGQAQWIAEFRTLTVVFVSLAEISEDGGGSASLHRNLRCIQEILERFEGTLYQFLMDDKGLSAVCAFGLPPLAHENDPRRAVEAAIAMREELSRLGAATSTGIATGTVFCGVYGSDRRRQYTTLGSAINLSARLMQAADGAVLCDEATSRLAASGSGLHFEPQAEIAVKGRSDRISVFAPSLRSRELPTNHFPAASSSTQAELIVGREMIGPEMVGREKERAALTQALEALVERGESGCIVIEGEAGVGKSCLLENFSGQIAKLNGEGKSITCWRSSADSIRQSTPYHVWDSVFRQALLLHDVPVEAQRDRALAKISSRPDLLALAPLLNVVVPLAIPETESTKALEGQARAETTQHFLVQLLTVSVGRAPTVLILEDAHWFDSSSWRLLLMVAQQISPLLIVLSTRPVRQELIELEALMGLPSTRGLTLESLNEDAGIEMICRSLGVKLLPPEVAHFIQERAGGHPLFSLQLAYALRDTGVIEISGGQCLVAEAAAGEAFGARLAAMRFPSTVEGVITSRLDRMPPAQQLTLKVACVLGQNFRLSTLAEIHPVQTDRAQLAEHLAQLESLDLIRREARTDPALVTDPAFVFRHAITQDVAYNTVPFAQRRVLHRSAAEAYEREFHDNLAAQYSLLAHHWSRAEVVSKAVHYCSEAGAQALRNHANPEAVRFLSEALRFDEKSDDASKPASQESLARRAEWELQLGRAYVNWSKYVEGRTHLERGLALQHQAVPSGKGSAAGQLLAEVLRQGLHRAMPATYKGLGRPNREALLKSSRNFEALTEIYFLQDQSLLCLLAVFRSLNLAEFAGASPELARGYSSLGSLLGFMTLHRAANGYFTLAKKVSAEIGDPASQAWVSLARAVYLIGLGQWHQAAALLTEAMSISDRIGDRRRGDDARIMLTLVELFQGKFSGSLSLADSLYGSAKERLDVRIQAEALYGKAWNLLLLRRMQDLRPCLDELDLLRSAQVRIGGSHRKQDVHSLRALLHFDVENFAAAKDAADQVMQAKSASYFCNDILVHSAISEVYLGLWKHGLLKNDRRQNDRAPGSSNSPPVQGRDGLHENEVRQSLAKLRAYSRIFPIGEPLLFLRQGQYEWIRGNQAKAIALWRNSLQAATTLHAVYYQGLADLELATHMGPSDPSREKHLGAAKQILGGLGAARDLARLRPSHPSQFCHPERSEGPPAPPA